MDSKLLTAIACLFVGLLTACTTRGPNREAERLIAQRFGGELQVLQVRKLLPSAPLARWNGTYGLYLQDVADAEAFMVRMAPGDDDPVLAGKIQAARQEKTVFVAQQREALAQLRAAGLPAQAFSLRAVSPLYGNARWNIAVFADMDALGDDRAPLDDAALRGLSGVMRGGLSPAPAIALYPASARHAYGGPLKKGYHGILEFVDGAALTYMQSQDDGADIWWHLDAAALPAGGIVSERQPSLRAATATAIGALRTQNHFFRAYGFYIQPTYNAYQAYRISERLRAEGLRQGHTAYAVLDRVSERMVLRGIATEPVTGSVGDAYALAGVYAYEYVFATRQLRLRQLPH
ncbi:hypothetical protein ACILG0_22710 [Pseudomonadota bacterium AL_CKDN230030165-1A_HGKHYDSX7]